MPLEHKSIRDLTDKEAAERVTSDLNDARVEKDKDFERCKRYRAIYKALNSPDDKIDETSGNIEDDPHMFSDTYMPIGAALVDAQTTNIFNHFFGTDDYFAIDADNEEDELFASRVTAHMKKRHKEMKFRHRVYQALTQAACFDYGVTMCRWLTKGGYKPKRVTKKSTRMLGGVGVPYQKVTMEQVFDPKAIDRPDMVVFDYFYTFHDPAAKDIEDSRFFIDQRKETFEDLQSLEETPDKPWGRYKNIREVIKKQLESDAKADALSSDPVERGSHMNQRRVLVTRYWTNDHVVEMAQDLVIARYDISGMPLQIWRTFELPSEFKGMGLLQRVERNQQDVNASLNSIRDFQNLVQSPIAAVSAQVANREDGKIVLHPGKVLTTTGRPDEQIKFYQPGVDTTGTSLQSIQMQVEMMRMATHVSENQNASYASGRRSATEAREVAAGADNATFQLAQRLEETCLEPFYLDMFVKEQAFLSDEQKFKYLGPDGADWMHIEPADYYWNSLPTFSARGSTYQRFNDIKTGQFMKFVEFAMTMPQFYDMEAVANKAARVLDPDDHLKFIRDPRTRQHNIPPDKEKFMLAHGQHVEVSEENNHPEHIQVHTALKRSLDYQMWPPAFQVRLDDHIAEHQAAMQTAMPSGGEMQDPADAMRGQHGPLGVGNAQAFGNEPGLQAAG